jgi:thiamine-phosphate pyrophosphorylase
MTKPDLPLPVLMLVTDRRLAGGDDALVRKVSEAVEAGVNVVQLREKDLSGHLLVLARRVKEAIGGRALLIVNGSPDVAREAGADGFHLPEDAPMCEAGDLLVGRSVHSVEAAQRAKKEGADYVIAGPVYETASHPGRAPAGPQLLSLISDVVSVPVLAIGGITEERVAEVIDAGAAGVAVISAVLGAASAGDSAEALADALQRRWLRDRGALA